MIGKRILTTIAALGVAASAVGAASTAASAASVGIYFGVPGIFSAPPPNPSCWQWNHWRQAWVWTCSTPHPNYRWDVRRHRYYGH